MLVMKQVLDLVLFLEVHAGHADAAALLLAVGGDGQPLDVAGLGDGDRHLLFGDEILEVDLALVRHDVGAAVVVVETPDLGKLGLDDAEDGVLVAEQRAQVADAGEQAGVLFLDLVALEAGELLEPQVEDGLSLRSRELEGVDERVARRLAVGSVADDADDLVEIVEGDEQALEDVGPRLGLVELELGPPDDDLFLEGDVRLDHLGQGERARHTADQSDVDDPEGRLHLRVLVELVEHDHRDGLALELDDEAHAGAVRLVAQVADLGDLLGLHEVDDVVDQRGAVDLVRQLRDDDGAPVALELLGVRLGADADASAARAVGLFEAAGAEDDAAGREVRPLDELHEVVGGRLGVVDHVHDGVDDLAEVVRRDVGRHADGDAGRAVDQEVGHAAGQHLGLAPRLVVVGHPVDGVGVDVAQHLHGDLAEARLGVTHGRRRVALDGAEVALAVDERVAHVEVLGHAHERRVDRLPRRAGGSCRSCRRRSWRTCGAACWERGRGRSSRPGCGAGWA